MDPVMQMSSGRRIWCGPVGHATVVKLATNLMSVCIVQATSEALALAIRHGVDAERWMEAVAANANSSALAMMKMPTMLEGDYDPHFSLDNMAKDSRYAARLMESAGLDAPALDAVLKRMGQLVSEGMGDLDYSVLAKPYLDGR
jgi:3-hydroxyisobutyrate dehydrogenase-like beta-hydroxyacid dehydrogenase